MSNEEAEDAISRYRQALLGFETCCSRDFREVLNGVRGVAVKLPWVFGKSQLSAHLQGKRRKTMKNREKQKKRAKKNEEERTNKKMENSENSLQSHLHQPL